MARVEKYTNTAVYNLIAHNNRNTNNPSNKEIDPSRSYLNYKLSLNRKFLGKLQTDYEYYKLRKSLLHVHDRADVKTACGWIVTAPKDLDRENQEKFFVAVYDFLSNRYGGERGENIINAVVHLDETTPHLHFLFLPVVANQKGRGGKTERICAKDVITREELRAFHPALQLLCLLQRQ